MKPSCDHATALPPRKARAAAIRSEAASQERREGHWEGVGRDGATSYPNSVTLSMSRVFPKRTASDASAGPSSVSSSTSDSASAMLT